MSLLIRDRYIDKILEHRNMGAITVLTGIAYSGRSVLLKQAFDSLKAQEDIPQENIIFVDLIKMGSDREKNSRYLSDLIYSRINDLKGSKYLFIDNIEYADNWGRILYGCKNNYYLNVYIALFNSNYLTNKDLLEIAYVHRVRILPFSFKEAIEYSKLNSKDNVEELSDKELFEEYQRYGGLPEVWESDKYWYKEQIRIWSYQNTLYPSIYHLYHRKFAENLIKYLIGDIGNKFNKNIFQKFVNQDINYNMSIFNLSKELLSYYIEILKNIGLILPCGCIDLVTHKSKWGEDIFYLSDSSFYFHKYSHLLYSKEILESIIFTEFLRRDFPVSRGFLENEEITFVHNDSDEWIYIQVEISIADETLRSKVFDKLNHDENAVKYVLSMDTKDYSTWNIKHINIIDFLKNEDSITIKR